MDENTLYTVVGILNLIFWSALATISVMDMRRAARNIDPWDCDCHEREWGQLRYVDTWKRGWYVRCQYCATEKWVATTRGEAQEILYNLDTVDTE